MGKRHLKLTTKVWIVASIFLLVISVVAVAGCSSSNEAEARKYCVSGTNVITESKVETTPTNLPKDIRTLTDKIAKGAISLSDIKAELARLDGDLNLMKDAFAKANAEYMKVQGLSGIDDWVEYSKNLIKVNNSIVKVDESYLLALHEYMRLIEAGQPADINSIVTRVASQLAPIEEEMKAALEKVQSFAKAEGFF